MAPSMSHITTQLRQLIYYHLDNNLLKNALFLASRLVAYDPKSAEAAYLLSLCQHQSGFVKAAWDTSRPFAIRGTHLGCCYIFAQASLELGRFVDGTAALDKSRTLWQNRNTFNQHTESRRQHLPDAAAVLCLKGKLCKAQKNLEQAVESWANALKLNPFMWDAFIGLCEAGAKVSVPNIYKLSPEIMAMVQTAQIQAQAQRTEGLGMVPEKSTTTSIQNQGSTTNSSMNHMADPFVSVATTRGNSTSIHGGAVLFEKLNNSKISVNTANTILDEEALNTPSTVYENDEPSLNGGAVGHVYEPPGAPGRRPKIINESTLDVPPSKWRPSSTRLKSKAKGGPEEANVLADPPAVSAIKRTISGHVAGTSGSTVVGPDGTRRSTRLQNTNRPPSANGSAPPAATTSSRMANLANSLGLREGRDIKKTRAPLVKGRSTTTSNAGRVVSGNRMKTGSSDAMEVDLKDQRAPSVASSAPPIPSQKTRPEISVQKELEALQALLDLFCRMASAQLSLSNYDCQTAIHAYNSMPSSQRETPYILSQLGRAYFEQASYADAEKFFIRIRQIAPSRLEDMEIYSTVLWHLKSEIELAYLAHELSEVDRLSPQAWCAIGNSFSLQREHEQALKCFKRATQLEPTFAYGFTLQGHEYIANEEYAKALDAYRCAISADPRHYNAWYGLGKVYEKMGKWSIAEQHYRTAAGINPGNAVLICCIGTVLEKLKDPEQALQMYTRACNLAPQNALSRFKKARVLLALTRPREALTELKILKDVAPDEANVWFLMGKLYKMLHMKSEAVKAYTMSLNLDPKAAQFIKDAMENLDEDDDSSVDDSENNEDYVDEEDQYHLQPEDDVDEENEFEHHAARTGQVDGVFEHGGHGRAVEAGYGTRGHGVGVGIGRRAHGHDRIGYGDRDGDADMG